MGGFTNESNNIAVEDGLFEMTVKRLYCCCRDMKTSCVENNDLLPNNEIKISCRLLELHLNSDSFPLRFIPESLETADPIKGTYDGRADIKVVSKNWFNNLKDYYLIECKRIDGEKPLNNLYVSNGVSRFVLSPPKYPSYHNRNIVLGYVVSAIDIEKTANTIADIQITKLTGVAISVFELISETTQEFYRYSCKYRSNDIGEIELAHLFYDFSSVMETTRRLP